MSKVRDRQTYRWTEKEVNNAKSVHSLERNVAILRISQKKNFFWPVI